MQPEILGVATYPLCVGASVALGCLTAFFTCPSGVPQRRFVALTLVLALSMLVGAKAYYLLEYSWQGAAGNAGFTGGYRQPGVFVALLFAPLAARILAPGVTLAALLDSYVLPIAVGLATFRVGCFLRGCCFGALASVPWAVSFPEGSPAWSYHETQRLIMGYELHSLPVHPLQLYIGAWALLSAGAALSLSHSVFTFTGARFLLLVVFNEGGKAVLETFRPPLSFGVDTAQAFHAIVAAMGGMILIAMATNHRRRQAPQSVSEAARASSQPGIPR